VVDTEFAVLSPFWPRNTKQANHLGLVDRFSQSVSTCAANHHAFFRQISPRRLTPEAKSGVRVNLVSTPTVLVDSLQFNQIVKEQLAHIA